MMRWNKRTNAERKKFVVDTHADIRRRLNICASAWENDNFSVYDAEEAEISGVSWSLWNRLFVTGEMTLYSEHVTFCREHGIQLPRPTKGQKQIRAQAIEREAR